MHRLVCLGLWMAGRTRSDAAKLIVLFWALLAFISSGFEHSVANMTVFGLGIFQHVASWSDMWRNLAWTVPGNIVGGGVLVGLAYAWVGSPATPVTAAPEHPRAVHRRRGARARHSLSAPRPLVALTTRSHKIGFTGSPSGAHGSEIRLPYRPHDAHGGTWAHGRHER